MIDQGIYPTEGIHSGRLPSSRAGKDPPHRLHPCPHSGPVPGWGILQALSFSRSKEVGVGQREGKCENQALCPGPSQASIQLILRSAESTKFFLKIQGEPPLQRSKEATAYLLENLINYLCLAPCLRNRTLLSRGQGRWFAIFWKCGRSPVCWRKGQEVNEEYSFGECLVGWRGWELENKADLCLHSAQPT